MQSESIALEFERHRQTLQGLAYRMLGSITEAQDVVQETYLRWNRQAGADIHSAKGWLIKTCSRLAMDQLKSARKKREVYRGPWLPEPYLEDPAEPPDRKTEVDDSVSMALLVALEKLTPQERAAILLHDVFSYSFEEVGSILEKSPAACRKLASRARGSIQQDKPRFKPSEKEHRRLLESFFEAVYQGRINQLESLLSESVELHSDGGGKALAVGKILSGNTQVAKFFCGLARLLEKGGSTFHMEMRRFNGLPGLLLFEENTLTTAISLKVEDGKIQGIYALRNPDKLAPFSCGTQPKIK
ncbi:MAG: RNA polymerase sigma factor SigJ [Verrucomicrobiae bacterium]|nr:RNA polymerase sigma factor SigJ [Verrucomicrobiae bacterium]